MRLAHLILTHTNPGQLERLINRLAVDDAHFFIHIDRKVTDEPFRHLAQIPNVSFVNARVKVQWGGYSMVQATTNGLEQILSSGKHFDYINLLSGQDYPIKSTAAIHRFFSDNPGKAFMSTLSVYKDWKEAIPRIEKYHLTNFQFKGSYRIQEFINKLMPMREFPNGMTPVGRSQWFSISAECAAYIVDYLNKHPAFKRFFMLTWAPDEMIFQTIIYNSHLKDAMVNDNLLYVDWSAGQASPKLLTMDDAETLKNSEKLFARKFNPVIDSKILDYLDHLD